MRLRPIIVTLAALALAARGLSAQFPLQTYNGAGSPTGAAFGSSFDNGSFIVPHNQATDLQAIIGDPMDATNGADAGAAFIYASPTATSAVWSRKGGQAGALYGFSVANIGDIDGDGYDDFAVGAPKQDSNGTNSGSVFVYSGASGAQIHKHDGDAAGDQFGYAVCGVGDVNNNGYVDYAIGAPFNNNAGANAGRVRFFDEIGRASCRERVSVVV